MEHICTCLPRKHDGSTDLKDFGPSKCQSHLAKLSDINSMLQRALCGDRSVFRRGFYADVSETPSDLQEALNMQVRAAQAYDGLPDAVKRRWPTPGAFLEALNHEDTLKDFVKLGLAFERTPEGPIEVKVINPVTAKADGTTTVPASA